MLQEHLYQVFHLQALGNHDDPVVSSYFSAYATQAKTHKEALATRLKELGVSGNVEEALKEGLAATLGVGAGLVQQVVEQQRVTTDDNIIIAQLPKEVVAFPHDEARIVEVLSNLINNAIKYSPHGTTITVGVDSPPGNNEVVVWVRDQGYGIGLAQQKRLFEKFYRATDGQAEKVQGLGLGLYISCEIIKQHGGRMWVESEVGKGSTFYFSLPVKRAEQ